MYTIKFPVTADTTRVRIRPPNCDGVLSAGPLFVNLTQLGQPQAFTKIQGGPCTVSVLAFGEQQDGRRMVSLEIDGATATVESIIVCKKIAPKASAPDKES